MKYLKWSRKTPKVSQENTCRRHLQIDNLSTRVDMSHLRMDNGKKRVDMRRKGIDNGITRVWMRM